MDELFYPLNFPVLTSHRAWMQESYVGRIVVNLGTTLETSGLGYNVIFKPRLQWRRTSYPWKWKLFVPKSYHKSISFLTAANKSKVYYGIPPEPDLGVVIEEENEEEEDKDKPKVSTF